MDQGAIGNGLLYTILDGVEDTSKPLKARFRGTIANVINKNNRLYPMDVLRDAVERMKTDYIATGRAVGESPHPKVITDANGNPVFETSTTNSVWKITDVMLDENTGEVFFDAEIIRTAKGKDVEAMLRAGTPVGDSMRALGTWVARPVNGRNVMVATYLDIPAFDAVMNPATDGAESIQVITDAIAEELKFAPGEGEQGLTTEMMDSIAFTTPVHPETGEKLTPHDPDNDGDVDFYTDSKGNVFVTENYSSHETRAHSSLRQLGGQDDGDNYQLAYEYMRQMKQSPMNDSTEATTSTDTPAANNSSAVTDSVKEDDQMDIEALVKDEKFLAAIRAVATETAKPALDAVSAQEAERQQAESKAQARQHLTTRLDGMKDKLSDEAIKSIMDSIADKATSVEVADALLDSTIDFVNKVGVQNLKTNLGVATDANQRTAGRQADGESFRVQVTHEPKPWQPIVDSLLKGFDEYGEELGHFKDEKLRKANQPLIDKILKKFENNVGMDTMRDSAALLDSVGQGAVADSISITTAQLLNQPTILEAVIVQAFQDVESLQFMMSDTFEGTEWRIPVETFTGNYQFDNVTATLDMLVPEGQGIPESNTNLTWMSFSPRWRRNAFSMSEDVQRALVTGPAKYPAVARAIYHLGFMKRRRLDDAAYYEMILASDEYNYKAVAAEVATAGNLTAVADSTNVKQKYQAQAAGGSTFPVVRARTVVQIAPDGSETTTTTHQVTVTVPDATPQVQGYLDASGNIQGPTGVTFAVDYENGIFYFNAASNVSSTNLPTVKYDASTNYDTWHTTVPNGVRPEDYYNTLLQQITNTRALMGSHPRYKAPNLDIMSLNVATYIENASMWYKLNSPEGSTFNPMSNNYFGSRSGVNFARINAPWVAGDQRMLLTQKGSTRYGIQTAYAIEGPFQKYDPTTGLVIDAKSWIGKENSVLATPQVTDKNGTILNPVSRTIRIVP